LNAPSTSMILNQYMQLPIYVENINVNRLIEKY